jgi:hypothetical protein
MRFLLWASIALAASPAFAQAQNERIELLEKRLNDLTQEVHAIRTELDQLKGGAPAPAASGAPAPSPAPTDADDLTKIDVPAATQQLSNSATTTDQSALTDVQTVTNSVSPATAKVFNPDTSVIGNFMGKAGAVNPYEFPGDRRAAMQLDEAEVAFEAFVDPYAKAKFFLSATPAGLEVEEGFAQFVALPYDLTAKAGKFKALFGKANTWHTHVRPWVDQPLVIHNFFGDEQFADSGVSVSKLFPSSAATIEATGEIFRGEVGDVFQSNKTGDLAYNGHVKVFRDITENSNVEIGTSYARGRTPVTGGTNQFGGIDVTYRWKPLSRGIYNSLIARFEGIVDDRSGEPRNLKGFYTSLDYQLAQRWFTGVRLDRADRVGTGSADRGVSATLTFWPSEFSQIRGQLRHTSYGDVRRAYNELLFQLQFAIGAHGAHTF